MVAAAAAGSLAAPPGPDSRAFLNELWNMSVPSGEQRYFDGMLYLMNMMHCAGEFRIIGPGGKR
jgi:oligosaccharide reducing-end xylanase